MKYFIYFLYNLHYKDGNGKGFHPYQPALSVSFFLLMFTLGVHCLVAFYFSDQKPVVNKYAILAYWSLIFLLIYRICVNSGYFERNYNAIKASYSRKDQIKCILFSTFFIGFTLAFFLFAILKINNQSISDIPWHN
jgi:hypothetical protein